jgi:hypothetical protein
MMPRPKHIPGRAGWVVAAAVAAAVVAAWQGGWLGTRVAAPAASIAPAAAVAASSTWSRPAPIASPSGLPASLVDASPSASAPARSIAFPSAKPEFEFVQTSGPGTGQVRVSVIDPSMMLSGARPGTNSEWGRASARLISMAALAQGLSSRELIVAWMGGPCDKSVRLVVDHSLITIAPGPQPACDALGIGRAIVLEFPAPVRLDDMSVEHVPGVVS